ncbi:dihydrolipoamide acetyltransferase [Palleronia sediminis]|uniref:Dihydrolipoyllysine-residue acetyltransferase component of pyruvate dehydrogenase complex n=1 Tax=Palleronia sediminis TaxID=2547833 RepID=A0A4R6A2C4_9RHOB|nr:2-oxo acid dehydrogenase subunit E2 [Palleronia sediminis]TDL77710.1 dihydrolipoamide acetyltransferase [Palleronia sediminis]
MVTASPSTRKMALAAGIDLDTLAQSTGRTHLAREDVVAHRDGTGATMAGAPPAQSHHARYWEVDHAAYGPVEHEDLDRIAQVAAANLGAANAMIPQVTHHDRANVQAIEDLRARMKPEAAARGVKLTALAFHVKVLARCLVEFPRFNASLTADGERLVVKQYVHVGIAVDTPGGLLVPVIRDADRKGIWRIASEIGDLAARAQSGKLKSKEMGGASMTISNLGGIGGEAFTPIVNPPELAILGLTRTELRPVWNGAEFAPVPTVPLDLSYDHRVLNGADAARFLARYAEILGDPRHLLLPRIAPRGG